MNAIQSPPKPAPAKNCTIPSAMNNAPTACPTCAALRVERSTSPLFHHRAARRIRPPSSG